MPQTNHGSGAPEASEETVCKRQEWPAPGGVSLVDKNLKKRKSETQSRMRRQPWAGSRPESG